MKSLILMGSPRKRRNTAALLDRLVYGRNKISHSAIFVKRF